MVQAEPDPRWSAHHRAVVKPDRHPAKGAQEPLCGTMSVPLDFTKLLGSTDVNNIEEGKK